MKIVEMNKAVLMRRRGFSINEISNLLRVSKSTVSLWVRNVKLSEKAVKILSDKMSAGQRAAAVYQKQKAVIRNGLVSEFSRDIVKRLKLGVNENLLLCSLLYWCEGSKANNDAVRFMNSDPLLLKKFVNLLRGNFEIDESKFRVCLHLHNYHDVTKQLKFWSKTLRIPVVRFIKPYIKNSTGLYKKANYPGCASLRYHDVEVARKLKGVAVEFIKKGD